MSVTATRATPPACSNGHDRGRARRPLHAGLRGPMGLYIGDDQVMDCANAQVRKLPLDLLAQQRLGCSPFVAWGW